MLEVHRKWTTARATSVILNCFVRYVCIVHNFLYRIFLYLYLCGYAFMCRVNLCYYILNFANLNFVCLPAQVYHCGFIDEVVRILRCVCFQCSRLLLDEKVSSSVVRCSYVLKVIVFCGLKIGCQGPGGSKYSLSRSSIPLYS